jgi:glycosyltransferase involved in cell wall biosynthesis
VVGDAGLLIDPYDAGQLASALRRLLDSPALRAELGGKAKARSGMFTLERMGRETLSAYLLAVERAGEG